MPILVGNDVSAIRARVLSGADFDHVSQLRLGVSVGYGPHEQIIMIGRMRRATSNEHEDGKERRGSRARHLEQNLRIAVPSTRLTKATIPNHRNLISK